MVLNHFTVPLGIGQTGGSVNSAIFTVDLRWEERETGRQEAWGTKWKVMGQFEGNGEGWYTSCDGMLYVAF